ncbi:uncharacterized protein LOC133886810 [Phragmites australis]|uniref:uncharacterized protein LOC133886810 n=1 Tax=Phragmites australis TaxID=29695 RepID=UPI002D76D4D8|nr:uncharacterized protein LOC133886810 [Phragmites australis]
MEPQPGSPTSPSSPDTPSSGSAEVTMPPGVMPASDEPMEEVAALEPGKQSTSSSSYSSSSSSAESLFHIDVAELSSPLAPAPEDEQAAPVQSAEVKPDDWAKWPEQQPQTVDDPFLSDGGAALTGLTKAPEVQTTPKLEGAAAGAGGNGFDPERIPASVFQPRTSLSQAEWSVASNESLFSIQGASNPADLGGFYGGSRSHFDYFYDEAVASAGGTEADSKLPTVAEGSEPGDALDGAGAKEFTMPGSARSEASGGSAGAKKAAVFRRHESGSGGSSSNFSFAFPILAETSPKKRDGVAGALYQPLQKEYEQPLPPLAPPVSAFEEMTTEEERRRRTGWFCCGQCCGCCWFAYSCRSCCCCCCRWQWWRCGCCRCSCPCSWCLCF